MFRRIALALILCCPAFSRAQALTEGDSSSTKIGSFLAANSVLSERISYDLGKIGGTGKVELSAVKVYAPGSADTIRAIEFFVTESGQYGTMRSAFLDIDEAHDLLLALAYMSQESSAKREQKSGQSREIKFTTRDRFVVGYLSSGLLGPTGMCRAGRISTASMWMSLENIEKMGRMIHEGLSILGVEDGR